jgi:hypothetical protein
MDDPLGHYPPPPFLEWVEPTNASYDTVVEPVLMRSCGAYEWAQRIPAFVRRVRTEHAIDVPLVGRWVLGGGYVFEYRRGVHVRVPLRPQELQGTPYAWALTTHRTLPATATTATTAVTTATAASGAATTPDACSPDRKRPRFARAGRWTLLADDALLYAALTRRMSWLCESLTVVGGRRYEPTAAEVNDYVLSCSRRSSHYYAHFGGLFPMDGDCETTVIGEESTQSLHIHTRLLPTERQVVVYRVSGLGMRAMPQTMSSTAVLPFVELHLAPCVAARVVVDDLTAGVRLAAFARDCALPQLHSPAAWANEWECEELRRSHQLDGQMRGYLRVKRCTALRVAGSSVGYVPLTLTPRLRDGRVEGTTTKRVAEILDLGGCEALIDQLMLPSSPVYCTLHEAATVQRDELGVDCVALLEVQGVPPGGTCDVRRLAVVRCILASGYE